MPIMKQFSHSISCRMSARKRGNNYPQRAEASGPPPPAPDAEDEPKTAPSLEQAAHRKWATLASILVSAVIFFLTLHPSLPGGERRENAGWLSNCMASFLAAKISD